MDETLRQVGGSLANLVTMTVFIKDTEPPVMDAYRSWLHLILCDIRLLSPALEPLESPDDLLPSLVEAELFQEPDEVVGEGLALTAGWRALGKLRHCNRERARAEIEKTAGTRFGGTSVAQDAKISDEGRVSPRNAGVAQWQSN